MVEKINFLFVSVKLCVSVRLAIPYVELYPETFMYQCSDREKLRSATASATAGSLDVGQQAGQGMRSSPGWGVGGAVQPRGVRCAVRGHKGQVLWESRASWASLSEQRIRQGGEQGPELLVSLHEEPCEGTGGRAFSLTHTRLERLCLL